MKIETNENGEIILKEVYSGIRLETVDKELFAICMRDSGFEFSYAGEWYEAKQGIIKKLGKKDTLNGESELAFARWVDKNYFQGAKCNYFAKSKQDFHDGNTFTLQELLHIFKTIKK